MLWKRMLKEKEGKYWRRIYKSLLLLAYLLRNGSTRVVDSARDRVYDIRQLEHFEFLDAKGKDQGINGRPRRPAPCLLSASCLACHLASAIACSPAHPPSPSVACLTVRQKAKDLCALLVDDDRLRDERKKAKANKDKYTGVSNEHFRGGGGGSFGGSSRDYSSREDTWERREGGRQRGGFSDEPDSGVSSFRSDRNGGGFSDRDDGFGSLRSEPKKEQAPAAAAPAANLLDLMGDSPAPAAAAPAADFGDFDPRGSSAPAAAPAASSGFGDFANFSAAPAPAASTPAAPAASGGFGDFAAFQSAPAAAAPAQPASSTPAFAAFAAAPAPTPAQPSGGGDLLGGLMMASSSAAPAAAMPPMGMGAPLTAAPAPKPAPSVPSSFGGLDISLDSLSVKTKVRVFGCRCRPLCACRCACRRDITCRCPPWT